MKPSFLFLSLACLVLAAALFLSHRKSQRALDSSVKQSETYSNEVAELRTKLHLAEATALQSQTNLQGMLDKRVSELVNASNVVVQIRAMLTSAQQETARAQRELQIRAERIGALETQSRDLARQVESLRLTEKELAETRENLRLTSGERETLLEESQRRQLENADLQRKLNDLQFLRWQMEHVQTDQQTAKRLANARPGSRPDFRRPIIMRPDGTVEFAPPAPVETEN